MVLIIMLSVIVCADSFCAVVSDNDGAAFISQAEFDSLKSEFQSDLNRRIASINQKIDSAIAAYLSGVSVGKNYNEQLPYNGHLFWFTNDKLPIIYKIPNLDLLYYFSNINHGGSDESVAHGVFSCKYLDNNKQQLLLCDYSGSESDSWNANNLIWNGITKNAVITYDFSFLRRNSNMLWNGASYMTITDMFNFRGSSDVIKTIGDDAFNVLDSCMIKYRSGSQEDFWFNSSVSYQNKKYNFLIKNIDDTVLDRNYRYVSHYSLNDIVYNPFMKDWGNSFNVPCDSSFVQQDVCNVANSKISMEMGYYMLRCTPAAVNANVKYPTFSTFVDTWNSSGSTYCHPNVPLPFPFQRGNTAGTHDIKMFDTSKKIVYKNSKINLPEVNMDAGMYIGNYKVGDKVQYTFEIGGWYESNGKICPEFKIYLSTSPFEYNKTTNAGTIRNDGEGLNYWQTDSLKKSISFKMPKDGPVFAQIVPVNYDELATYRFYVDTNKNSSVSFTAN